MSQPASITLDADTTLAAAVDRLPALAREFERRGLDYCCGGQQSLADACAASGLDLDQTLAELSAIDRDGPVAEWTTLTADALVDHLELTHHRYLWDEMPRLTALVDKIVAVHGERHPELAAIASCYGALRAELEPHLLKEERVLFPMIRDLATSTEPLEFHCGSLRNPISVMLREHDAAGELLARLRQLTDGYAAPGDGCANYHACFTGLSELEADTHLHIHKENNVLFPMVVQLEADRAASSRV